MNASTPGTHDARRVVVGATVAFAALLVVGGWLILWARDRSLLSVFAASNLESRLVIGAVVGVAAAAVCAVIVRWVPQLERLRRLAEHATEGIEPRWHTMLAVATAAGVSEEFFFRGALEPAIGAWLSGLAFVVLHGAIRLRDPGTAAFAVFLFGASMGLSALNRWQGLEAAMAAHTAYDLAMLAWLSRGVTRSARN
jgi:membrane protease YdiL (CAAX protease family)